MAELLKYRYQPLALPVPKASGSSSQSGLRLSKTRGRGMEFDEVRHYQAGDDVRAIDWRVTARTGQTHTKLFREEKERPVFLCVDFSNSMWFGSQLLLKSLQAAHVAAGIAWHTIQRGDRVGGLIYNNAEHSEIKPQGRQHGALLFLKQLIALHPTTAPGFNKATAGKGTAGKDITAHGTVSKSAKSQPVQGNTTNKKQTSEPTNSPEAAQNLAQQLRRLLKLCRPGADIVLISDFSELNAETIKLLQSLHKHHTVTAVMITDPFEEQLPQSAFRDIDIYDGKETHRLFISNPEFHRKWQEQAKQWLQVRAEGLRRAGVRVVPISAGLPAHDQWIHRGRK
ncbi:DUF58 domain-containing protein [Aliidiomarina iranensis]|uniref:DUF58 domain-containing protein n=2 Tax=Aliidiomarina iranensis TaxID=1434071 RepID=A0A432VXH3_9GAMM|nr:DUF58 domain-containing protein [Aliidiomarina iranensis]